MKFLGTFEAMMDDKNRLVIPSKWRENLGKDIVLNKGYDGCLTIRKAQDFNDYYTKNLQDLEIKYSANRALLRQQLANSTDLHLDKTSRFVVPQNLAREAGLTKKIILIGVGVFIEIWDADRYTQIQLQDQRRVQEIQHD